MKLLFFRPLIVAAFVGSAPFTSGAATNFLTVEALVVDVLAHNPELAFYQEAISTAKLERATATKLAPPELATQLGHKSVRSGGFTSEGVAWSVGLQQTFEWPGRMPLRKAIANHQVTLAELGLAQFRTTLAGKTRVAALTLVAAQMKADAVRSVADRLRELKEVLVQRDPAGLTPLLETRIIEATELTLQKRLSEADLARQTARLELNQLRGSPWEDDPAITATEFDLQPLPTTALLLAVARTNNFDLQSRQTELEQQGFKIALAKNERYPAVTVGPYVSEERAGDRERTVGLSLSVLLPLWNNNQSRVQAETSRHIQAQTSLNVARRQLEKEVSMQVVIYQNKFAALGQWRPDSIAHFRDAAEMADRHYRLGAVPAATYIELQKQYLEAVEALLDTRREALEALQGLQTLTGLKLDAGSPKEAK